MSDSINPSELQDFDMAHYLDTPEAMAAYLTVVLEERGAAPVADALCTQMRISDHPDAHALTVNLIATRQEGDSVSLDSVMRACAMLGLKLVAQPT